MNHRVKLLVCLLFLTVAGWRQFPALGNAPFQTKVDFARDIQPLLAAHCNSCHNDKKASGQLRLDVKSLAMKGGISGTIIEPGNAKASRLLARVLGEGGEVRMPLKADPLTDAQIALIERWINEGANWPSADQQVANSAQQAALPTHWAYRKPIQPTLPSVRNTAWVRNPVDAFILARLEKEGLQPLTEADRAVLLRRVSLDLTGLPPTPAEVDAFINDKAPDAYEKIVDRLLASTAYGERWARPWLDLARYADSNGYEKDNLRTMWKYRDWVINALNRDMPFDQFTIEQIAGDMLPNATIEQKIATGFHRNTMVNQEGGVDPYEARWDTIVDRVSTTGTTWLGSTIGCAQCHNHKYDPFSQKDFYKLFAFFENAKYEIAYQSATKEEHTRYVNEPQLELPTPEQAQKRKALNAEIEQLEAEMKAASPALAAAQTAWEDEQRIAPQRWTPLDASQFSALNGTTLAKQKDLSLLATGAAPEVETYVITAPTQLSAITGLRIETLPDASLPKGGPGRDPYGNFLLTGIEISAAPVNNPNAAQAIRLSDIKADDAAYKPEARDIFAERTTTAALDRPAGWFVNATGDDGARLPRQAVILPAKPFGFAGGTLLTIKLKQQGGSLCQALGRFRLSVTTEAKPDAITNLPARQRPVLALPAAQRSAKQQQDLTDRFRSLAPELKPQRDRLNNLRDELKALGIVTALVMEETKSYERPATFIRERGNFMSKGAQVYAATPAVLHNLPERAPANRLGLALWLVDENNPLVARVTVNRFWEQLFGRGLVETSEDFGTQGALPSHPELLDWLAVAFMTKGEPQAENSALRTPHSALGWSMKKLLRLLVTSAAYRQAATATPALLEKDPYNRLLARGPRFRMEAEMLRDTVLTTSGLLARKVGGPSVMPLQPEGIWRAPYSSEKWKTSAGADRYRRSLYTFVRRSSPYPMMLNFDGVSREACTVRRTRTNTPLQALNTLNDEALFEAARALAQRMLNEASGEPANRVTYGLRLCIARVPQAAETARLTALYQQQLAYFTQHPTEAEQVVNQQIKPAQTCPTAEMAAWTMVANVLLNLDETMNK